MPKMCIIGETDPFIARLLRRFAEESGLHAVRAQVGQDVLELARQVRPEVVILEAELPGEMRGWEAVQALGADQELCHIPVIICSWLQEAEARRLVGDKPGYLQKPELHYDDFVKALKQAGVQVGRHLPSREGACPQDPFGQAKD